MHFDLALILVLLALVTGVIWAIDAWLFRPRRLAAMPADGSDGPGEPAIVEYARSFFPVILLVLVIRSFLYEPFRIPSSSMRPTLVEGDFIFVNKFVFGLRLPVLNKKVLEVGTPERGDVVVFRLPSDTGTNYIKRIVGLPGDRIAYRNKKLTINGKPIPVEWQGAAVTPEGAPATLGKENLDGTEHEIIVTRNRQGHEGEFVVQEGYFFVMGDNRDNSRDSRYPGVGPIPEGNLVGKAVRIWLNWDFGKAAPKWSRIGDRII